MESRGKLVMLRPMKADDTYLVKNWLSDCDVTRYLDMETPFVRAIQHDMVDGDLVLLKHAFVTVALENNALIGFCRLQEVNETDKNAKILQVVGEKKYWGGGFAFDARMLLLHYAFNVLGLIKVYGRVYAENTRMLNQAKRAGAKIEGVLQKQKFRNGKFHDLVLTATFKEDWEQIFEHYNNA